MSPTEMGNIIALLVTLMLMATAFLYVAWLIIRQIRKTIYLRRLKKIDMRNYHVFATRNGLPVIFQHNENPNSLIHI